MAPQANRRRHITTKYTRSARPSDDVRQEYRVKSKISMFARSCQIPADEIGILVISGQFLFHGVDDVAGFVDYIIEEVYDMENIPAVVLISDKIFGDPEIEDLEEIARQHFIFIRNQISKGMGEDIVIVKNRFCKFKFDYENLELLFTNFGTRINCDNLYESA